MYKRGFVTAISTLAFGAAALAQETSKGVALPEVVVTTQKAQKSKAAQAQAKPKAAQPATPTNEPPGPAPEAAPSEPGMGEDLVPKVSASQLDILALPGMTITDAIQDKPGVSGSTFAPGANRPILRGLDNNRVRVQEGGVSTGDVSALSEDHAVTIDPCAAESVDVIRGPAALRYGSTAIGGVVNVETNRIPTAVPSHGFSAETRGFWSSADDGRTGCGMATAGSHGVAVHADAFRFKSDDYETPIGRQANSFVDTKGYSLGASLIGSGGFAGFSYTRYDNLYAIPGVESAEEKSRIDMGQDRWSGRTEFKVHALGIDVVRASIGYSDYAHNEVVFDDVLGEDAIGSRFTNKETEGRVEVQHVPLLTGLGRLVGTAGIQASNRDLTGLSFEGDNLLEATTTDKFGAFLFEDLQVSAPLHVLAAVRFDNAKTSGTTYEDITDASSPLTGMKKTFQAMSESLGATYDLSGGVLVRGTVLHSERAPEASELFSKGAHEATSTFELGNPNLDVEKAWSFEGGFRKATGGLRFDTTAYYTIYDGFIFQNEVAGQFCEDTLASCGTVTEGLQQVVYGQRDATFYGTELSGEYDVAQIWRGVWGLSGRYDFVHAEFSNGDYVPRMPPHRLGGGLYYRDAQWASAITLLHAFGQHDLAPGETATDGYTRLNAEISYRATLPGSPGASDIILGIRGDNLLDEKIRNSTSFKKDEVLEPGASVKLFGSLKLN